MLAVWFAVCSLNICSRIGFGRFLRVSLMTEIMFASVISFEGEKTGSIFRISGMNPLPDWMLSGPLA